MRLSREVVMLVLAVSSLAAAAPKYVGKKMTVEVKGAEYTKVFRLISDVSKRNIVLIDEPSTPTIDLNVVGQPWDQILDDVVARSGLSSKLVGDLVLVGKPPHVEAFAARKFTGKRLAVQLVDAGVREAVELVARAGELDLGAGEGKRLTLKLHNVPADYIVALLIDLAGSSAAPRMPAKPGCAAPNIPLADLKLQGTATGTATPFALIDSDVVGRDGCVGTEKDSIKTITRDAVRTTGRELAF